MALPHVRQPVSGDAPVTRPWYQWFQRIDAAIDSSSTASSATDANVTLIATALGSTDGTAAGLPSPLFNFGSGGSIAAVVNGQNAWFLSLTGDAQNPGNTYYYGTGATGIKGWFAVADALDSTANVTLTVGTDGITTIDIADLADSGAGALLAITRDAKGRISGTKSATIAGTAGRVTVANGNASAGLPTIDLATVSDAGGGSLQKTAFDAYGRKTGTSSATTSDLAEGTNLYYTDARADARITLQKGQPSGLASLDSGGKLDTGQLPALAITETSVVSTEAAMLALTAQQGDVAVRTDLNKSLILTADPASTLANWQELLTPTGAVTSFNGRTGSVVPASSDYTFAQIASTPTTLSGYGITDAEPSIAAGTTSQYWRGDKTWRDFATDVRASVLTGLSTATSAVISATDTVLVALGNLQAQVSGKVSKAGDTMTGSLSTTGVFGSGGSSFLGAALFPGAGEAGVWAQSDSAQARLACVSAASNVQFIGARCSGTLASPLPTPSVVALLEFDASTYDGSAWVYPGVMSFLTTQAHSTTAHGTQWRLSTTPTGTTTLKIRMLVDRAGDGAIEPGADNVQAMGSSALRWSVVYAGTGTINTSDAREKTAVTPLTDVELAAASDLARAIGTYQWLASVAEKGDAARHHAGLTVQQAIAIMQSHGLDPFRYGFICYDSWPEQPEVIDPETGEVTQEYRPAGDRYSFRTDELLIFIARGAAAERDAQSALIADLTARLTALEAA